MKKITIAIDGYAACGKSTLAKKIAKKLSWIYVDSGAMYRAVTLYFLRKNIDLKNKEDIETKLNEIFISFDNVGRTILNGEIVESEIRDSKVSNFVSQVSAISEVRKKLVDLQREIGKEGGIVMDGRDIGTVVFPNAELKLFISADLEIRVERRFKELNGKITREEVRENLSERDWIDSTRSDSPLKKADDAIEIDNSYLTPEEQLDKVLELVMVTE
jgi:cytidylate kinase